MHIVSDDPDRLELRHANWFAVAVGSAAIAGGLAVAVWDLTIGGRGLWSFGAIASGVGGVALAFMRRRSIVADTVSKTVLITSRGLIGEGTTRELAFQDLQEVVVEERMEIRTDGQGRRHERPVYNLIFVLNDGRMEPVDITPPGNFTVRGLSVSRFRQNNAVMEMANRLAKRLGVPCTDRRMPTFGQVADVVGQVLGVNRGTATAKRS